MLDISSVLKKDCVNVGLFGIGRSTLGAFEYLLTKLRYKEVKVTVRSDDETKQSALPDLFTECTVRCKSDAMLNINEDILILSPSVRADRDEFNAAKKRGVVVTSDAEIFFSHCVGDVFGITGSDGKSTTSKMAHLLLGGNEGDAALCGNYGVAMSKMLLEKNKRLFVTELSSFMINDFAPSLARATITNITPNHLNWHKSYDEYKKAKENILINAKERALWAEGEESDRLIARYEPQILISSTERYETIKRRHQAKHYLTKGDRKLLLNGDVLCDLDRLLPLGEHTVKNFMNAVALTLGYSTAEIIQEVADTYIPLPHRCESVGIINGKEYIDSSIDSSPQRVSTTLLSLGRKVTLILCGRGKGLSYEPMIKALKMYADKIVLGGEISEELFDFLTHQGIDKSRLFPGGSFCDCVKIASEIDRVGVILLSPGATSYDEFKSFEERGDAFKKYVTKRK